MTLKWPFKGLYGALWSPMKLNWGSNNQARSARHLNKEKKAKITKIMIETFKIVHETWPKIGFLRAFMEPYGASWSLMEPRIKRALRST